MHDNPLFQLSVLLLFIIFILWVVRLKNMGLGASAIFHIASVNDPHTYATKSTDTKTVHITMQIVALLIWSALLSLSLLRVVYEGELYQLPDTVSPSTVALTIFSIPIILSLYQVVFVSVIGAVNLRRGWCLRLIKMQLSSNLTGVTFSIPALLLTVVYDGFAPSVLFYIVVISFAITLLNDIFHSLRLFLTEKLSISDWFLYLCTVKLLPLSFVWRILTF